MLVACTSLGYDVLNINTLIDDDTLIYIYQNIRLSLILNIHEQQRNVANIFNNTNLHIHNISR